MRFQYTWSILDTRNLSLLIAPKTQMNEYTARVQALKSMNEEFDLPVHKRPTWHKTPVKGSSFTTFNTPDGEVFIFVQLIEVHT